MSRPAFVTAALPLASLLIMSFSSGLNAQTIGIAACDDFLTKYDACVTSKIPEAQRVTFQSQLDQLRKTWSEAAKNASTKATLESVCKQSAEAMKSGLTGFGCAF